MIKEIEIENHGKGYDDRAIILPSDTKGMVELCIEDADTAERWSITIDPDDIIKAYNALKGEEDA